METPDLLDRAIFSVELCVQIDSGWRCDGVRGIGLSARREIFQLRLNLGDVRYSRNIRHSRSYKNTKPSPEKARLASSPDYVLRPCNVHE